MHKNKVVFFDIDYTLFNTDIFKESGLSRHEVYREVIEVLEELKKTALLGIFSEGEIEFQKKKLKETDLEKYFETHHTHIVLKKLLEFERVLGNYTDKQVFVVDDKLGILHDAKKIFPKVFTIWVKRGPFARVQEEIDGFKPDATIENLSEIVNIIVRSKE